MGRKTIYLFTWKWKYWSIDLCLLLLLPLLFSSFLLLVSYAITITPSSYFCIVVTNDEYCRCSFFLLPVYFYLLEVLVERLCGFRINFALMTEDAKRAKSRQEQIPCDVECQCITCQAHKLEVQLPPHFQKHYMQTNTGKTTHVELKEENATETSLTTVGNSVNGQQQECKVRKLSANSAFNSMQRIWLRNKSLSVETKMRLYNSCVQSRLLYNAGASSYKRTEVDKLDA